MTKIASFYLSNNLSKEELPSNDRSSNFLYYIHDRKIRIITFVIRVHFDWQKKKKAGKF